MRYTGRHVQFADRVSCTLSSIFGATKLLTPVKGRRHSVSVGFDLLSCKMPRQRSKFQPEIDTHSHRKGEAGSGMEMEAPTLLAR